MKLVDSFALSLVIIFGACSSKPKVIVEDAKTEMNQSTPVVAGTANLNGDGSGASDVHQVVAGETLNTDKYTYINVTENQEKFWIAVPRQEIVKGHTYYYRGGLKKTNFESQEFKRVFDVIYLVPSIIDASEHPGGQINGAESEVTAESPTGSKEMIPAAGAVKISELIKNKAKYNGKTVLVSGKCIKANYQIMGRNWFHLQDGSEEKGKKIDLTVTSADNIQIGDQVNFKGIIAVNKDFGAGYKYEIIMESAVITEK